MLYVITCHCQSMADGEFDLFTGLIGPIIITRRGMGGPDRRPTDVDREVVAFLVTFNEVRARPTYYVYDMI
jgi:hypothetical protein